VEKEEEYMKKFYLVVCSDCVKEKRVLKAHFHLSYRKKDPKLPYLHCRCYVCGAEEDFFFMVVGEGEQDKVAKQELKIIET
jgi:hypothetical protein